MAPPRTPRGVNGTSSPSRSSARAATSSPYSRPTANQSNNKKSSPSTSSGGLLGRLASFVSPFRPQPNSSAFGRDDEEDEEEVEDQIDEEMAMGSAFGSHQDQQESDRLQAMESGQYHSSGSKGKGRLMDDQEENPAQRLNRRGREVSILCSLVKHSNSQSKRYFNLSLRDYESILIEIV